MQTHNLLNEEELEWSPIVANNTMNRERQAIGINSYEKDIRFNPIRFIEERIKDSEVKWLDLCCGRGKALIQTANYFKDIETNHQVHLTGFDLVNFFDDFEEHKTLHLQQINLSSWNPQSKYDLITIVHGLHYIGDKLALIKRSVAALKPKGLFIANLDLQNIILKNQTKGKHILKKHFSDQGLNYSSRSKILSRQGEKTISFPFQYLGADDKAGPNYTGQAVVNSFYE